MKTFTKILMVLSMSFGLTACDPDDGRSMVDGGGGGAAGALAVDAGPTTGTAQFIGVWRCASLDAQATCTDGTHLSTTAVSGTETFTQGTGPNEVIGVDDKGCRSDCQVSGTTANCQTAGTECGDGVTVVKDVYTYSSGSLSEDSTVQGAATAEINCVVSGVATLIRVK